jgi:filamentous hemagglutinin family protein
MEKILTVHHMTQDCGLVWLGNFNRMMSKINFILLTCFFLNFFSLYSYAIDSTELPSGGQVQYGDSSINIDENIMTIDQASDKSIIQWDSFNIGSDAVVNINQPSSSSALLNRVRSSDPSQIFGSLNSNGQVFLINPNGVLFGRGASVNVGALITSTLSLSDQNFLNDTWHFSNPGNGFLENRGSLTGGLVALISPVIKNEGEILAKYDAALLASGDDVTLTFADSRFVSIAVNKNTLKSFISNYGSITANQGLVLLKASAAQTLIDQMINSPNGADNLISVNGVPRLISSSGAIKAASIEINAGANGMIDISGFLDVSSDIGHGGRITLTGHEVSLFDANINATGYLNGGEVLVGGDWQGSGDLFQASFTTFSKTSLINASSRFDGDGGKVVIWSDIKNTKAKTYALGSIYANGMGSGSGGMIETSGYYLDTSGASGSASSQSGKAGLWLFDPYDYTIGAAQATSIETLLNNGTSVNIQTSNSASNGISGVLDATGDIFVNSSINANTDSDASLTLTADGSIYLSADIITDGAQIYNGDVILSTDISLTTSNAAVTFNNSIDGLYDLTVNSGSGNINTNIIGSTTPLYDLSLTSTGIINVDGNITTFGSQTYNGNIQLGSYSVLYSKGVSEIASTDYTNSAATGSVDFTDGGVIQFILYGAKGGTSGSGAAGANGDIYTVDLRAANDISASLSIGNNGGNGNFVNWWGVAPGGGGGTNSLGYFNGSNGADDGPAHVLDFDNRSGGGGGAATVVKIGDDYLVAAGGNGGNAASAGGAGGAQGAGGSQIVDANSSLVYDTPVIAANNTGVNKITYSRSAISSLISLNGDVNAKSNAFTIQTDTLSSNSSAQISGRGIITINAGSGANTVSLVKIGEVTDEVDSIFSSNIFNETRSTFTTQNFMGASLFGGETPGSVGVGSSTPSYAKPAANFDSYQKQLTLYDANLKSYQAEKSKFDTSVKAFASSLNAYESKKAVYEEQLQTFTVANEKFKIAKAKYEQKLSQHKAAQQNYRNAVNRRNSLGWFKFLMPVPTPPAAFTLTEPTPPQPITAEKPVPPNQVAMAEPTPPEIPMPPVSQKSKPEDTAVTLTATNEVTENTLNNGDKEAGAGKSAEENNDTNVSGTLGNQGNDKDVGNAGGQKSKPEDTAVTLTATNEVTENITVGNDNNTLSSSNDPSVSIGKNDVIQVKKPPSFDLDTNKGNLLIYQLPEDTFNHSNPDAKLSITIKLNDGERIKELPNWIEYNDDLKQIKGVVPNKEISSIKLRAIARDERGNETHTDISISLN